MIIYSVTISIDEDIETKWVEWMRNVHIPDVMKTGLFVSCRFSKLTSHKEEGFINYSAQYTCESKNKLDEYQSKFSKDLQKKSMHEFADKIRTFRTELRSCEDFIMKKC